MSLQFSLTGQWVMLLPAKFCIPKIICDSISSSGNCQCPKYSNIQTDKDIEHMRPDIVCINKEKWECQTIDFVIPSDENIAIKEQKEIDKDEDLRTELQNVWNVKVVVIPEVIGALGTM